jgi:hypothetical protein
MPGIILYTFHIQFSVFSKGRNDRTVPVVAARATTFAFFAGGLNIACGLEERLGVNVGFLCSSSSSIASSSSETYEPGGVFGMCFLLDGIYLAATWIVSQFYKKSVELFSYKLM